MEALIGARKSNFQKAIQFWFAFFVSLAGPVAKVDASAREAQATSHGGRLRQSDAHFSQHGFNRG